MNPQTLVGINFDANSDEQRRIIHGWPSSKGSLLSGLPATGCLEHRKRYTYRPARVFSALALCWQFRE